MYNAFVLTYATLHSHVSTRLILDAMIVAILFDIITIPAFGRLSDKIGRRPVYLFGAACTALLAYPLFWALDSGNPWFITGALTFGFAIAHAAMYGPQAAMLAEMFPTSIRYTGMSTASQVASILAAAPAPFVATKLFQHFQYQGVSWYLIAMSGITFAAILVSRETYADDIVDPITKGRERVSPS